MNMITVIIVRATVQGGGQPITLGKIVTEWVSPKLFIIVHDY